MTSTTPLEVKVIFDASSRGRRRPTHRVRSSPRVSRSSPWIILGVFNLLAAGGLCYVTWWRVDPFLYMTLMLKTPVETGLNAAAAGRLFGLPPSNTNDSGTPTGGPTEPGDETSASERPSEPMSSPPRWQGRVAQVVIGVSSYGWLTLSEVACCALGLAGGTAVGRVAGAVTRRIGMILSAVVILGLGSAVYVARARYGWQYPPGHLRLGMAAMVFLCAALGVGLGRGVVGWTRFASLAVILSAVGSVVALYLGAQGGAVEPVRSSPAFLALVFIVHSFWGWVLAALWRRFTTGAPTG